MRKPTLLPFLSAALFVLASGCSVAATEDDASTEQAATTASSGTVRRTRYVLLQAEVDNAQLEQFRGLANVTIVSSYEAGIYWAKKDAVPSVQDVFDAAIDKALAKIDADIAAKEATTHGYEETIILGLAGHSTGSSFFGHANTSEGNVNYARLSPERVTALAARYPRFAKNIRGLLLLGCNAGHKDKMDLWRKSLPSVVAVAGFNSRAPTGANGGNNLVRLAIGAWQKLGILNAGATVSSDDKILFKSLDDCRAMKCLGSMTATSYGFVVQGSPAMELVVGGTAHWSAVYAPGSADTVLAQIKLLQKDYDAYLQASDAAHADPPANTDSGTMRQYNNLSQQYLSAVGLGHATPADLARVAQSIRLTLFRDVRDAWLEANPAVVHDLDLDPNVLATLTRRELLAAIHALPPAKLHSANGARIVKALVDLDTSEIPDAML
jgi:hypothetical protein